MTTPREQIAKSIREHSVGPSGTCSCGCSVTRFKNPRAVARRLADSILPAALPALEQEIREKVAQEILDSHRLYECHEQDPQSSNHPRACVWEIAQSIARDVRGKDQP